ncbi:MAG: DUF4143 domain-containing protein [Candidatus Fibromonas sp.]|jgi:hypothetical protein|nr:DUF4143 domain-containing protein [Candidatus Fibromonas sp.]
MTFLENIPEIQNVSALIFRNGGTQWIVKRKKKLEYSGIWKNCWFWRTKQQQEIDYLEEGDGRLNGYEIKWNPKAKIKGKNSFLTSYKNSSFEVIDKSNVEDFL